MTLYSADILDLGKPVSATAPKKGKKGVKAAEETTVSAAPAAEEPSVKVEEKPKRIPTEKQLAALARAQETRKRKREEAEAAAAESARLEEERLEKEREKEEALLAKKEAMKLKRKLARDSKKQMSTPPATESSVGSVEEEIEAGIREPVSKKVATETVDGAPVWFKQYVAGVKKEEAKVSKEKKPQRQIKQEAMDVAEHQWNDGFTRDRVRNEVDNHMSRMYQMMFSGRRLK
jgi:hypothetical protein